MFGSQPVVFRSRYYDYRAIPRRGDPLRALQREVNHLRQMGRSLIY